LTCKIYISTATNPWFNLATEDWIFHQLHHDQQVLLLWRNEPSVIIGRAQNPWIECNLKVMAQHNVKLARRQSGGGTVFHDLGNLNFTFFSAKTDYDKRRNLEIIASALRLFELDPIISERNDILINHQNDTYKISGSAFRESKDFAFHHGTLLLNANKSILRECLRAPEVNIEATGVKSVRSKVINLSEINPLIQYEVIIQAIAKQFLEHYQTFVSIELLEETALKNQTSLMQSFELYQTWDWLYARTLPFVHRIKLNTGQSLNLHVHKGLISEIDTTLCSLPELINLPYSSKHIECAFNGINTQTQAAEIKADLLGQIP